MNDRWTYTFAVWPDETWNFDPAVFTLFHALRTRLEMQFSSRDFERFRSGLSHHGLTLREVERMPSSESELVR